jgi:hypothetical protein
MAPRAATSGARRRQWPSPPRKGRRGGYPDLDDAYWQQARAELAAVKVRLGFVPADIAVCRFREERVAAGIADLPAEFEEFLADPDAEGPAERAEMTEAVARWRRAGNFVWRCWGLGSWLSAGGEVLTHD